MDTTLNDSIFDKFTDSSSSSGAKTKTGSDVIETPSDAIAADKEVEDNSTAQYTAKYIKAALQELLKFGLLEADKKPKLYQTTVTQQTAINTALEPLDFNVKLDEIRGLAFLQVAQPCIIENDSIADNHSDEWAHPLVRRQRLNLEQSLLIALLRQYYIVHEQEVGLGAGAVMLNLDEIMPQLQMFLGDSGSDNKNQKRLRNLLDHLKTHGIVSEVNEKEDFTIRPIITHMANPESLQGLLQQFDTLANLETTDTEGEN